MSVGDVWCMVMFDLPVLTKPQRRAATEFRKSLEHSGYIRVQYSVYARWVRDSDRADTERKRVAGCCPTPGNVRVLAIRDATWADMLVIENRERFGAEEPPPPLVLFEN